MGGTGRRTSIVANIRVLESLDEKHVRIDRVFERVRFDLYLLVVPLDGWHRTTCRVAVQHHVVTEQIELFVVILHGS